MNKYGNTDGFINGILGFLLSYNIPQLADFETDALLFVGLTHDVEYHYHLLF